MKRPDVEMLWKHAIPTSAGYREAGPDAVAHYTGAVRVVDVREPDELYGELGHVPGSELMPPDTLLARLQGSDPDALLVLVCRSGVRSGRAAEALVRLGFRRVVNMSGGMIAWNDNGFPLGCGHPGAHAGAGAAPREAGRKAK